MAKRQTESLNLLDLYPVRKVEWEEKKDGTVFLKKPKSGARMITWFIQKCGRSPFLRIHLDEFGTSVWHLCTGDRTVEDIGKVLHGRFGQKIEPVYDRLGAFIKMLAYEKCILYQDKP